MCYDSSQEVGTFSSFLECVGSLKGKGALLFRSDPETSALRIFPHRALLSFSMMRLGDDAAVRKHSSLWVDEHLPLVPLCQGVHTEDKCSALSGMQPICRAS